MSKRRGALSNDPLAIERRLWYENLQKEVFGQADVLERSLSLETGKPSTAKSVRSLQMESSASSSIIRSSHREGDSILTDSFVEEDDHTEMSTVPPIEEKGKLSKALSSMGEFQCLTTTLADESDANALARESSLDHKDPDILPYVKPHPFFAAKWLVHLTSPSMQKPKSNVPRTILICFHGIAGSPSVFRKWALPVSEQGIDIWAVCLPGRSSHRVQAQTVHTGPDGLTDVRSVPVVQDLAQSVYHAMVELGIVPAEPSGTEPPKDRIVLFGHDLGALVAFEVARFVNGEKGKASHKNLLMDQLAGDPSAVILSRPATSSFDLGDDNTTLDSWNRPPPPPVLVQHVVASSTVSPYQVTRANRDRFVTKYFCASDNELLRRWDQHLGGVPDILKQQRQLLRHFIPLIRSDYEIMEKYFIRDYIPPKPLQDQKADDITGPPPLPDGCDVSTVFSLQDSTLEIIPGVDNIDDDDGRCCPNVGDWGNMTAGQYLNKCVDFVPEVEEPPASQEILHSASSSSLMSIQSMQSTSTAATAHSVTSLQASPFKGRKGSTSPKRKATIASMKPAPKKAKGKKKGHALCNKFYSVPTKHVNSNGEEVVDPNCVFRNVIDYVIHICLYPPARDI